MSVGSWHNKDFFMIRFSIMILLLVLDVVWCANYQVRRDTTCKKSYDCTSTAPCCRDADGHAIVQSEGFGFGPHIGPSSQSGTCSSALGGKGEICDSSCGCQTGYKCYRPMSGVCCPPMRCYNATWVDEQRKHWANCRPPTCFLPP